MLFGRDLESAQIDEVLDAARERRSGALVLRGEAGIGKTALLDAAVERATDMRVSRSALRSRLARTRPVSVWPSSAAS